MPAAVYDTVIEQGSSFVINFIYTDNNGSPIDITNYCVLLQWLTNTNDLYSFSNRYDGTDYSLVAKSDGTITLTIPSKTTNDYVFDSAVYDLDIQEPNEEYPGSGLKTYRLATGTIRVLKRITSILSSNCADLSSRFELKDTCDVECGKLDIYSAQYDGAGFSIPDMSSASSSIYVDDTRVVENIEVAINGLRHNSPQDLSFVLTPPSGDSILLSANSKITNYRPGFSCMFSNRAPYDAYISTINSGGLCRIVDKAADVLFDGGPIVGSFDHLYTNNNIPGSWSLTIKDSDVGVSGSIDSWKLIITYQP